jgi:hypothetical protein
VILTSGVLVFAAAALLVDGVFFTSGESGTPWQIWASIVVSAAAALLLIAGAVRERSRRPAPAGGPMPPPGPPPGRDDLRIAPAAAPAPAPAVGAAVAEPAPLAPAAPAPPAASVASGRVLVVAGRPRYHLAGCRYVADRDAQELGLEEARAAGYTACGVCRPDDAGADAGPPATAAGSSQPAAPGPVGGPAAAAEPAPTPGEPPQAREAPEAAEPAPSVAAPVVLVRGRYHRPDCRYVAVAAERSEVSRAEARDAGALPCGVCRP